MRNAWAIIPARGGSKGVPRKNLERIAGKSLVGRAIETCRRAHMIDRVIVTTDDEEIAAEARAHGAEVVTRPQKLSGDSASSESALLHVLDTFRASGETLPETTLLVQCTSPFTDPKDLNRLVTLVNKHDTAFTAVPSHVFLWRTAPDGSMIGVNHDSSVRLPRQQLQPEFAESGNAYAMRTTGFMQHQHRFFGSIGIVEIDRERAIEIDTPLDLRIARLQAQILEPERWPDTATLKKIEAVIFDFDGVLTDDTVIVHQDGTEAITAHRGDGLGIAALRDAGVRVLILSKERNPVVLARAQKVGVEVIHGCDDKLSAAKQWLASHSINSSNTVYVGNDINDLEVMRLVGIAAAPSDARPEACLSSSWLLKKAGGRGAAREVADTILLARAIK